MLFLSKWFIVVLFLFIILRILGGSFVFVVSLVINNVFEGFFFDGFNIKVLLYIMVLGYIYKGIIVGKLKGVMFVIIFSGWNLYYVFMLGLIFLLCLFFSNWGIL